MSTIFKWAGVPVAGSFDYEPGDFRDPWNYARTGDQAPYLTRTGTLGTAIIGKSALGSLTEHSGRVYIRVNASMSSTSLILNPLDSSGGTSYRLILGADGLFTLNQANNGWAAGTYNQPLTQGDWYRVEWQATLTDFTLRVYEGDSLTVADELSTDSRTFGPVDNMRLGQINSGSPAPMDLSRITITDELEWIGPETTPTVTPGTDRVAIIGDSLTAMNGLNGQPIYDALNNGGFPMGNVFFWGVGGKKLVDPDLTSRGTLQNLNDAQAVLGQVDHIVLALCTNDNPHTDQQILDDIAAIKSHRDNMTGAPRITWIGAVYENAASNTANRLNGLLQSTITGDDTYVDADSFIHDGSDQTGWWVGDGTHMTPTGYAKRAQLYANSILPTPTATPRFYLGGRPATLRLGTHKVALAGVGTVEPEDPDPEPLPLYGASSDVTAVEAAAGRPVGVHRTYYDATPGGLNSALSSATSDINAGRVPWVSFDAPGTWAECANGDYDQWFDDLGDRLGNLPGACMVTFHHEPEHDQPNIHDFVGMHTRAYHYMRQHPNLRTGPIFTGWTTIRSGNPDFRLDDMWPGAFEAGDFIAVDCYNYYGTYNQHGTYNNTTGEWSPTPGDTKRLEPERYVDQSDYYEVMSAFAKAKGIKWAIGEFGMSNDAADLDITNHGRVVWFENAWNSALQLGDCLALAYFNSARNSVTDWRLDHGPDRMAAFVDILNQSPATPTW